MALKLKGSTSGFTAIDAPAVAGDNTLVLPGGNGTSGQYLQTDGAGALSWQTVTDTNTNLTRGTEIDTSSGSGAIGSTAVIYDNISSDVKRITMIINNVSTNNTEDQLRFVLRTGSGTDVTSGYYGVTTATTSGATGAYTKDNTFPMLLNAAGERLSGTATFSNVGGNRWVYSACGAFYNAYTFVAGGYVELSAQLTGIKVYSGNANSFDSGSINIFTEV